MRARPALAVRLSSLVAGILVPLALNAQQLPTFNTPLAHDLSTPAGCNKSVVDWKAAQIAPALDAYRKSTDSTERAANLVKYTAANNAATVGSQKAAADCAKNFTVASVPGSQLMEALTLYTTARDTTNVRLATERLMSDATLPPRVKGQALIVGMNQEITKASAVFGILDGAESYVSKIDALPDSLADIKQSAHRTMLGRYEYLDVADGLQKHATILIGFASKLQTRTDSADLKAGYNSLARSFADRLHPDSALRILDNAENKFGKAFFGTTFAGFRDRYALIGKPATAISAQWWINPDAEMVTTPAVGKVTLIEFTAHWCGPCKNSYPGLRSVNAQFKGQGFEGVMVTSLYGYIGSTTNKLNPEQEVAADREYFGKEHALPFPVAINSPMKQVTGTPFSQPKPDTDYKVGGIPQIIIVDKKGIIRQIVTGWDQGNTARFTKLIGDLLKEK